MRIAFLTPLWPPSMAQNGIATYVDVMSRALERRGHECVVISMWKAGESDDPRLRRLRFSKLNSAQKLFRRVRHRLSREPLFDHSLFGNGIANALADADCEKPVDIIEMEESFGLARYCVGRTQAGVVIRSHGPHFLVHQQAFNRADRRRIREEGRAFKETDAVSFPSKALGGAVSAHYGANLPLSTAYPNPVDIAPLEEAWTPEGCDKNTILFIGRFDAVKGSDVALQAFKFLAEKRPAARMIMAGVDHGIEGRDGEVMKFADYAHAHLPEDIRSRIEFLGPVPRGDVPELRRRAAINLCASRYETFPYAVTEALAMGAPVVSTATPGLSEYMTDGEDILFAPVGDADALSHQLGRCLDNPDLTAELGAAGRETAVTKLSPDVIAECAEAFYEQVVRRSRQLKATIS